MRFLTPVRVSASRFVIQLSLVPVAFLVESETALAQGGFEGGLPLQTRAFARTGSGSFTGGALPWMVGLVCLVLIGILVVTLWPNESDANPYQRQRKFARIDGLFLKISGFVLGDNDSRQFLSRLREDGEYDPALPLPPQGLTLMSLSFGGCSLASAAQLAKGNVILLHLHTLPDFPSRALTLAAKIVWTRPHGTGETYGVAGAKFIFPSDAQGTESLRQYLNFLMDEPLT